jgi:hypothetical protein
MVLLVLVLANASSLAEHFYFGKANRKCLPNLVKTSSLLLLLLSSAFCLPISASKQKHGEKGKLEQQHAAFGKKLSKISIQLIKLP